MRIERRQAAAAGIGSGTALLVVTGLNFSGGYYALAAGIIGAVVVIAATGALVLGDRPSFPALLVAVALLVLGAWSALSVAWGGIPDTSWRFLGLTLTAAAALILGSSLGAHAGAIVRGVLGGIALHALIVLVTVGSGSAAADWFQVRQLEGPVGYHNGEGTICALGVPLALWVAASRSRWARAAGAAAAVLFLAVTLLTQSRGSMAAIALAAVVQVAVTRRARLAALAVALGLAAVALFSALQAVDRALVDGRPLDDPAFSRYVALAFGLAAVLAVLSLPAFPPVRLRRRTALTLMGAGGALAAVAVAVLAVLLLSRVDNLRDRLTAEPNSTLQVAGGDTRLSSLSPTGRVELWKVAARMTREKPLTGSGTGSFPRRWSLERSNKDFYVLQPHSLELETLSELGLIGFGALAAVIAGVAWCALAGVRRDRAIGACVAAALAAFFLVVSVDWIHVFAGLTVPALLIAGAVSGFRPARLPSTPRTLGYTVAMLLALAILAGPAMAQRELEKARAQAASSPDRAWTTAATARSWNRWSPDVVRFQGLLAEQAGRFRLAARLYHRAAELDLQPWTNTFREARALRRAGLVAQARAACRRSIASNPLEPELRRGTCEDAG
ncbi:O-Antigen ligase [Gaiella occulta]|uniref:O-Antigen ligase n=1 Tax=Gaiella occulta TaxID=1002870 RepID=A0A7M2YXJ5_9ACTN|nr:O-antigen ligase family protein [Gaiella occulta]RDI74861.1 O-Antigen ligase [Gaiella occulta]